MKIIDQLKKDLKEYNWIELTVIRNSGTRIEKIVATESFSNEADLNKFISNYEPTSGN